MNIKVVLFASLREKLGLEGLSIDLPKDTTVLGLKSKLAEQEGELWRDALSDEKVLSAVDHTMVENEHVLTGDCEVAFFPPVTGG